MDHNAKPRRKLSPTLERFSLLDGGCALVEVQHATPEPLHGTVKAARGPRGGLVEHERHHLALHKMPGRTASVALQWSEL